MKQVRGKKKPKKTKNPYIVTPLVTFQAAKSQKNRSKNVVSKWKMSHGKNRLIVTWGFTISVPTAFLYVKKSWIIILWNWIHNAQILQKHCIGDCMHIYFIFISA